MQNFKKFLTYLLKLAKMRKAGKIKSTKTIFSKTIYILKANLTRSKKTANSKIKIKKSNKLIK